MRKWLLLLIGTVSELASVGYFVTEGTDALVSVALLHLLAATLFGYLSWLALPQKYRGEKAAGIAFFSLVGFVIWPVGSFALYGLSTSLFRLQKKPQLMPYEATRLSELIAEPTAVKKRRFGEASLREFASNHALSDTLRLEAFTVLTQMGTPQAMQVIKKGLTDKNDEIRLLSFSVVDKLESRLGKEINASLKKLRSSEYDESEQLRLHKHLAKLYWESNYIGLSEKALYDYFAEQSLYHLKAAEAIDANDSEVLFMLARYKLMAKAYDEAYALYMRALENGASTFKVIPFLAEIYFAQGRFAELKQLFKTHPVLRRDPLLGPVAAVWGA
jgi:tetratricopeptide (TPR) repeat protein